MLTLPPQLERSAGSISLTYAQRGVVLLLSPSWLTVRFGRHLPVVTWRGERGMTTRQLNCCCSIYQAAWKFPCTKTSYCCYLSRIAGLAPGSRVMHDMALSENAHAIPVASLLAAPVVPSSPSPSPQDSPTSPSASTSAAAPGCACPDSEAAAATDIPDTLFYWCVRDVVLFFSLCHAE